MMETSKNCSTDKPARTNEELVVVQIKEEPEESEEDVDFDGELWETESKYQTSSANEGEPLDAPLDESGWQEMRGKDHDKNYAGRNKVLEKEQEENDEDDNVGIALPPQRIIHPRANHHSPRPRRVPGAPRKRRRPNAIPFPFTPEQEKDLAEWFRDNPRFYNKRCMDYRITQVKQRMLQYKAKEFKDPKGVECTAAQLGTWWTNMRTCYGKMSKDPDSEFGVAGRPNPTERELWIKRSFTFLSNHIIRIKGRQGCKLRSKTSGEPETGHEENDDVVVLPSPDNHKNGTLQDLGMGSALKPVPSTAKRKSLGKFGSSSSRSKVIKKREKVPEESDFETLEKVCSTILKTTAPSLRPASPASMELENFARDIVSSMRRVPEDHWNDVKCEIMMVIKNFSRAASAPSFHPNFNNFGPNVATPPNLNHTGPGHAFYRAPAVATASPSQYVQQAQEWQQPFVPQLPQQPNMPAPGPGVQYVPLGTNSTTAIATISNTTTTTTDTTDTLMSSDALSAT